MLNYKKKGQIGETVTWIIATLVIIGILIIFILVSSLMAKIKAIHVGDVKTDMKESNLVKEKTSFAYQLTNNKNKDIIENILKNG
jgi:TRAP-type mannitol/chloroaromatic compound transport system permease small subunit